MSSSKDVTQTVRAGGSAVTADSILRCSLGVSSIIFTLFLSSMVMRGVDPPTWYVTLAASCIAATAGVSLPFSIVRRVEPTSKEGKDAP